MGIIPPSPAANLQPVLDAIASLRTTLIQGQADIITKIEDVQDDVGSAISGINYIRGVVDGIHSNQVPLNHWTNVTNALAAAIRDVPGNIDEELLRVVYDNVSLTINSGSWSRTITLLSPRHITVQYNPILLLSVWAPTTNLTGELEVVFGNDGRTFSAVPYILKIGGNWLALPQWAANAGIYMRGRVYGASTTMTIATSMILAYRTT